MVINIEKKRTFIPPLKANLALPPEEQITIEYDRPAPFQRGLWEKTIASRKGDKIETHIERDIKAILCGSNITIKNLSYYDTDENAKRVKVDITTGEQLANCHSDICYYISEFLVNEIMTPAVSRELLKNSESASDAS